MGCKIISSVDKIVVECPFVCISLENVAFIGGMLTLGKFWVKTGDSEVKVKQCAQLCYI